MSNARGIYIPSETWLVIWNMVSCLLLITFAMVAPIELGFDLELAEISMPIYIFYEFLTTWCTPLFRNEVL